ncbi:MAG TPA: protein kinase [Vicinamibacterales bacterium]|nr:protein kinase [Vicinamibacterales bacterium]
MMTVFRSLGPYEILQEIGRGGMATVYLAQREGTSRQVALKLVPAGKDREAHEALEAERGGATLQEQFSKISQYVPAVYETGDVDGYFFIAMEYLEGRNLSEVIAEGAVEPLRAANIAVQLCHFLEVAQEFQATIEGQPRHLLLHGDLKPRNIRVLDGDQIKILDFGIAKALSLSRKVTRNDFGSVAYLSPERLELGEIDEHADFWAVGVLLYEMLAGYQPFRARDTRLLEQRIRSLSPPAPLDSGCPPGLRAITAKLLAGERADRYRDARTIREDLESFVNSRDTQAEREGWLTRGQDEPATRRTHRPDTPDSVNGDEKDEAPTVRTSPAAAAPAALAAPVARAAAVPPRRRFFRTALFLLALFLVSHELWIALRAEQLKAEVPTLELDRVGRMWNQYDGLKAGSLRIGVIGLERALTSQTATLADRVIFNYRAPLPIVRVDQWRMAREALVHALVVNPDARQLRAALRYCDGQLHRINGETHKAHKQTPEALEEFSNAVSAFREAAELRPNWPDPFLGLTRTFTYGLEDVDRGADALKQAERFGYTATDRETALLADGYRLRAQTFVRTSRTVSGMPQELEYLNRATQAYRQAIDLYSKVLSFADVPRNLRASERELTHVEQRIGELSQLHSWPPLT